MAERITGHTELIGLMAYPIRHSSSPAMHNEAFATLGLGRLISLPFAGPLSDKLGRRFSVIIGCASYVVFLVGIATMGIKLFISVAQLLMPFFLDVAAGTMVALFDQDTDDLLYWSVCAGICSSRWSSSDGYCYEHCNYCHRCVTSIVC